MTIERFWEIIDQCSENIEYLEDQADNVTELLATLEPVEIISFQRHFYYRLFESYRWDLWAVAYIVKGGCSSDGFEYFRCWLIAQGKNFFEAVLREPQYVAEQVEDGEDMEFEQIMYAASYAYEEKTGKEIPSLDLDYPEPQGELWTEDDLERLYPDLCARFLGS